MGLFDFFARWRKGKTPPGHEEQENASRTEESGEACRAAAYDDAFMAAHFEGLGDIWEALLGQKSRLAECLASTAREGKCYERCAVHFRDGGSTVMLVQYPDNGRDIRSGMLLAVPAAGDKTVMVSCFPMMQGLPNPLHIRKAHTWTNNIEGVVAAEHAHDGPPVSFFAPFFFRDKSLFAPGAEVSVSLAALAFSCRKAAMQRFSVDEGPLYEQELQRFLEENPKKSEADFTAPVVSMEGARILLPQPYACEWQYRCPVLAVAQTDFLGLPVYKLHVIFVGVDEDSLAGYLYVPERLLEGYKPQPGDDIEGTLWMTGMLHDAAGEG